MNLEEAMDKKATLRRVTQSAEEIFRLIKVARR
jgi:hypothetical protein